MHLCFTCTGKTTQSKDREIKKKAFSAFWLSCSGNPRNLGARMCIDRSGALQAAAGFANSSSSSSSCTEPRGRTRHHQPPLKKGRRKHSVVTLPQSGSSTSTALECRQTGGPRDLVSAVLGLRFLAWLRTGPSLTCQQVLFKAVSRRMVFRDISSCEQCLDWPCCIQSFADLFYLQLPAGDHGAPGFGLGRHTFTVPETCPAAAWHSGSAQDLHPDGQTEATPPFVLIITI